MFSIDQNCHSLWDVVPKLQALAARGHRVRHFIEDIDVAFTALGSRADGALRLARERFHHSGGADWGAAVFYSEFLGRLPVDLRRWEPLTGMKTAALAKRLGRGVDDLYDEFSPGDNWQLIGPSYVGDREHHRVIGDLTAAETRPFLREMLDTARADMERAFPEPAPRARLAEWFGAEGARLETLLAACAGGTLVDLYARWLGEYVGKGVELNATSRLFACGADAARTALMDAFCADYDATAGLYNEAVTAADVGLRPLRTGDGELPFFATLTHQGRWVRVGVFLRGGAVAVGGREFPLSPGRTLPVDALRAAGVRTLAGKAALLVIQARVGPGGRPLAMPHRGSLYMPAVHALAERLAGRGLVAPGLPPVVRVRFRLLDRLRELDTVIRLPAHLSAALGRDEVPARVLGESHAGIAGGASARLEAFRTPEGRQRWQRANLPDLFARIDAVDARRRLLARTDPKSRAIRDLSHEARRLEGDVLDATLRRVADDTQLADLDYWDSRGALLPWCVALGGQAFYNEVIARAEIAPERPGGEEP